MGTFGTGPLDNDTAMDYADSLSLIPQDHWPASIAKTLGDLNDYDPAHTHRYTPQETEKLEVLQQEAVAAAAILADCLIGEPLYTGETFECEDDDNFDFTKRMPRLDDALVTSASRAVRTALQLVGHPDLGEWKTDEAAAEYAAMLRELDHWLCAALEERGGAVPAPLPEPAADLPCVTTAVQLAELLSASADGPVYVVAARGGVPCAQVDLSLLLNGMQLRP